MCVDSLKSSKDLLLTGDKEAAKRQMEDLNLSWVLKSDGNADLFKLDKDNLVNFPVWKQKLFIIQSFVEMNLAATACVLLLPKNFI